MANQQPLAIVTGENPACPPLYPPPPAPLFYLYLFFIFTKLLLAPFSEKKKVRKVPFAWEGSYPRH